MDHLQVRATIPFIRSIFSAKDKPAQAWMIVASDFRVLVLKNKKIYPLRTSIEFICLIAKNQRTRHKLYTAFQC